MEDRRAINFDQWNAEYENVTKESYYVVYFTGSVDSEGVNWCSDCRDTKDAVAQIETAAKGQNIQFLQVNAGLRDDWKTPENPLRVHKFVKATSIPLVVLYNKGKIFRKAAYEELSQQNIVKDFLEDL